MDFTVPVAALGGPDDRLNFSRNHSHRHGDIHSAASSHTDHSHDGSPEGASLVVRVFDKERVQRKKLLGTATVHLSRLGAAVGGGGSVEGQRIEGWFALEEGESSEGEVYLCVEVVGVVGARAADVDGRGDRGDGRGGDRGGNGHEGNPFAGSLDENEEDD